MRGPDCGRANALPPTHTPLEPMGKNLLDVTRAPLNQSNMIEARMRHRTLCNPLSPGDNNTGLRAMSTSQAQQSAQHELFEQRKAQQSAVPFANIVPESATRLEVALTWHAISKVITCGRIGKLYLRMGFLIQFELAQIGGSDGDVNENILVIGEEVDRE